MLPINPTRNHPNLTRNGTNLPQSEVSYWIFQTFQTSKFASRFSMVGNSAFAVLSATSWLCTIKQHVGPNNGPLLGPVHGLLSCHENGYVSWGIWWLTNGFRCCKNGQNPSWSFKVLVILACQGQNSRFVLSRCQRDPNTLTDPLWALLKEQSCTELDLKTRVRARDGIYHDLIEKRLNFAWIQKWMFMVKIGPKNNKMHFPAESSQPGKQMWIASQINSAHCGSSCAPWVTEFCKKRLNSRRPTANGEMNHVWFWGQNPMVHQFSPKHGHVRGDKPM